MPPEKKYRKFRCGFASIFYVCACIDWVPLFPMCVGVRLLFSWTVCIRIFTNQTRWCICVKWTTQEGYTK